MLVTVLAAAFVLMILATLHNVVDMIPASVWQWIEKKIGWNS